LKSNVSDFLELADQIYIDATAKCTADVSDNRDLLTIRSRVKYEGLSFLTISLPQFAKGFERSLAVGHIVPDLFRGFYFPKRQAIPAFLQGMLGQLFDIETGVLLHETPEHSVLVGSVRQICLSFKKVQIECTPERVYAAVEGFVQIEHDFDVFTLPREDIQRFSLVSSMLWDNMFREFSLDRLIPRHGPGATAERISGNQKYDWHSWYDRIEPYFHLLGSGFPVGAGNSLPEKETDPVLDELDLVTIIGESDELPVRVVTVPKTLKAPRIIAIEPSCVQYAQQGVRDYLYETLERKWPTSGRVNFTRQDINQRLALKASRTGRLATIDLSDASDRVPHDIAMMMFRGNPDLQDAIEACRSRFARLPDGRVIGPLRKFASMGSALCFPVEAMYFYTICVLALMESRELSYTFRNIQKMARKVYVYGDDIVVPSANAVAVSAYLHKYHCKVNVSKSFSEGNFRESCGLDAYLGMEVTPTYLRQERPRYRRQASHIISWVATANQFYLKGYWRTSQFMFNRIEKLIGNIPYGSLESEGLVRVSFLGYKSVQRWNSLLHRFEVKAMAPRAVYVDDIIDGYPALAKCLIKLELANRELDYSDPSVQIAMKNDPLRYQHLTNAVSSDKKHLLRSALHGGVALNRRWVPSH